MKPMLEYMKRIWKTAALCGFFCLLMAVVLSFYNLPVEPVCYGAILCAVTGIAFFFYGYSKFYRRWVHLRKVQKNLIAEIHELMFPVDANEEIYQEMLRELNRLRMEAETKKQHFYGELMDYYTMWAHQIKTPVSALRLLLSENGEEHGEALAELFKIEQYVEMVLGYLRTEEMSSDLNFRLCSLDEIVREQIHKYARVFVGKRISLEYEALDVSVVTDSKWLGFVVGQILSNALKYTEMNVHRAAKTGKITIFMAENRPKTLQIKDNGIGIRPEDLPRVFERGFTGYNGRGEPHSTGIGLYLSKKIMKKLGHKISIESTPGEGTTVFLELDREELELFS